MQKNFDLEISNDLKRIADRMEDLAIMMKQIIERLEDINYNICSLDD